MMDVENVPPDGMITTRDLVIRVSYEYPPSEALRVMNFLKGNGYEILAYPDGVPDAEIKPTTRYKIAAERVLSIKA